MATTPRIDLRPGVTELVVLVISRRQVEACDIASVLTELKPFLATREDAWLYRGQMTLVVDGYSEDPRELVDIAEVRSHFGHWSNSGPIGLISSTRSTTASNCWGLASVGLASQGVERLKLTEIRLESF